MEFEVGGNEGQKDAEGNEKHRGASGGTMDGVVVCSGLCKRNNEIMSNHGAGLIFTGGSSSSGSSSSSSSRSSSCFLFLL